MNNKKIKIKKKKMYILIFLKAKCTCSQLTALQWPGGRAATLRLLVTPSEKIKN
jgi:hypothetical protein